MIRIIWKDKNFSLVGLKLLSITEIAYGDIYTHIEWMAITLLGICIGIKTISVRKP
jgi:hypothetical protein